MAKTKPIGVRFRQDILDGFEEDGIADTPQQALNFLEQFYIENRPNKPDLRKIIKESALFKNSKHTSPQETEILNKAYSKTVSETPTRLTTTNEANQKRIAELREELKYPPKNPLIGLRTWKVIREAEIKKLESE